MPIWTEGNHEYSTTSSKHFGQHSNQTSLNMSPKHYNFKELAWSEIFCKIMYYHSQLNVHSPQVNVVTEVLKISRDKQSSSHINRSNEVQ